jgi:hypothetical protein
MMHFHYTSSPFKFSFLVSEPYSISLKDWNDFADGNRSLNFYMGNGEGSINIEDNNMIFVSSPEGA